MQDTRTQHETLEQIKVRQEYTLAYNAMVRAHTKLTKAEARYDKATEKLAAMRAKLGLS